MSAASSGRTLTGVHVPAGGAVLDGDLVVPEGARRLVLFAHGSGCSRHSPRNRFVAETLSRSGVGTLLVDLVTPYEEAVATLAADWFRRYFGENDGAR